MSEVWTVVESGGCYDTRYSHPVSVWSSESAADAEAARLARPVQEAIRAWLEWAATVWEALGSPNQGYGNRPPWFVQGLAFEHHDQSIVSQYPEPAVPYDWRDLAWEVQGPFTLDEPDELRVLP